MSESQGGRLDEVAQDAQQEPSTADDLDLESIPGVCQLTRPKQVQRSTDTGLTRPTDSGHSSGKGFGGPLRFGVGSRVWDSAGMHGSTARFDGQKQVRKVCARWRVVWGGLIQPCMFHEF